MIEGKISKRVPAKPASTTASRPITKVERKPSSRTQPTRTRKNITSTSEASSSKSQSSTSNKVDHAATFENAEPSTNSLAATLLSYGLRNQEASEQPVQ